MATWGAEPRDNNELQSQNSADAADVTPGRIKVPRYLMEAPMEAPNGSSSDMLAGPPPGPLSRVKEGFVQQLNSIPRSYRRLLLIVLPVGCILLANLIYFVVKSTVAFNAASNSAMKGRAAVALERFSSAVMDERDVLSLAMGTLGAAPVPLSSSMDVAFSITDMALSDAHDALAVIADERTDFNYDRAELRARLTYLRGVATDLAAYRTYASLYIVTGPTASPIMPFTHIFKYYTSLARLMRDWQLGVVRIGLDRQRTQSTAPFAAAVMTRAHALDLRTGYGVVRGLSALAVGTGRWETSSMYDTYVTAVNAIGITLDRLRFFGGPDVQAITSGWSASDPRAMRFNSITTALLDSGWFVRQFPVYTTAGPATNSSCNATALDRYIDNTTLIYTTLFPALTPASAAWAIYNETNAVSNFFAKDLLMYLDSRTQSEIDNVRRDAINDLIYTICVSMGAALICAVLFRLSERSSNLEVAAQEERTLARASEAFTNMIAHEMRNPLHGIVANVTVLKEMLQTPPLDEEDLRQVVHDIDLSAGQMMRLATDVLDIARLRNGRVNIVWAPTDLWAIIRDTMHEFRSLAADSDVNIEYDVDRLLPGLVWLDGARCRQLISNAVTNACKAIKAKQKRGNLPGRIIIRVRYLPVLADVYDRNLVKMWMSGQLDAVIARQQETSRAANVDSARPVSAEAVVVSSEGPRSSLSVATVRQSLTNWARRFLPGQSHRAAQLGGSSAKVVPLRRSHDSAAQPVHLSESAGSEMRSSFPMASSLGDASTAQRLADDLPARPLPSPNSHISAAALADLSGEDRDYIINRHGVRRQVHLSSKRLASRALSQSRSSHAPALPGLVHSSSHQTSQEPSRMNLSAKLTSASRLLAERVIANHPYAPSGLPGLDTTDVTSVEVTSVPRFAAAPSSRQQTTPRIPLDIAVQLGPDPQHAAGGTRGSVVQGSSTDRRQSLHRSNPRLSFTEQVKGALFGSQMPLPPSQRPVGDATDAPVERSTPAPARATLISPPDSQPPAVLPPLVSPAIERHMSFVRPDDFIGAIYVEIVDTGIGLGAENPEDKFIEYSSKFGGKSTGLGLPICRKLAHRMHGDVWLENATPTDPIFQPGAQNAGTSTPGSQILTADSIAAQSGPPRTPAAPAGTATTTTSTGETERTRKLSDDALSRRTSTGGPASAAAFGRETSPRHANAAGTGADSAGQPPGRPLRAPSRPRTLSSGHTGPLSSPTVNFSTGSPLPHWNARMRAASVEGPSSPLRGAAVATDARHPQTGMLGSALRDEGTAPATDANAASLMTSATLHHRRAGRSRMSLDSAEPSSASRTRFAPSLTTELGIPASNAVGPKNGTPSPSVQHARCAGDANSATRNPLAARTAHSEALSGAAGGSQSWHARVAHEEKAPPARTVGAAASMASLKVGDASPSPRQPAVSSQVGSSSAGVVVQYSGETRWSAMVAGGRSAPTSAAQNASGAEFGAQRAAGSAVGLARQRSRVLGTPTGAKLCFIIPVVQPPEEDENGDEPLTSYHSVGPSQAGSAPVETADAAPDTRPWASSSQPGAQPPATPTTLPTGSARLATVQPQLMSAFAPHLLPAADVTLTPARGRADMRSETSDAVTMSSTAAAAGTAGQVSACAAAPAQRATSPRVFVLSHTIHVGEMTAPVEPDLPGADSVLLSGTEPTVSDQPATPGPSTLHPLPAVHRSTEGSYVGELSTRRDSAASTPVAVEPIPYLGNRPVRVLFCDDEAVNLRIGERLLRRLGVNTVLADDGDRVLPAMLHAEQEGYPFAMLFLDITMKRVNGDIVCRQLRASGYTIPVVAVTGERDRSQLQEAGFSDIVIKPFTRDALVAAIRRWAFPPAEPV